jgi:hypothetical protein
LTKKVGDHAQVPVAAPTDHNERMLAVVRSTVLQQTEYGNTENIVRVIAEAPGEHSAPRVVSVSSFVVLSEKRGWISWPLSPVKRQSLPADVNGIVMLAVSRNSERVPCRHIAAEKGEGAIW